MNLSRKLLLMISAVLAVIVVVMLVSGRYLVEQWVETNLLNSAEKVRNVLMATRRIYHHQFVDSGLPLSENTLGFLPAHAMQRISEDLRHWDETGFSFNNVSDRPRNPFNRADAVEMEAIEYFRANPEQKLRFIRFADAAGKPYYLYAQPIFVEAYCLQCHGEQLEAPATIQSHYDEAFDYRVGELRGILSIKVPAAALEAQAREGFAVVLGIGLLMLGLLGGGIAWIFRQQVLQPLGVLERYIRKVGKGDLAQRIDGLPGEFGRVGAAFNRMARNLLQERRQRTRSEMRFEATFEQAAVGIAETDISGQWLRANRKLCEILGRDHDELLRHSVFELTHPDDVPVERSRLEQLLRGELPAYTVEKRFLRKDGSPVWVGVTVAHVRMPEASADYLIKVVVEIGERKRSEALVHQLAYFDPLTGLPNRQLFLDRLGQAMLSTNRSAQHGMLLLLDIDRFKVLNDTQSYDVGDHLLQSVAEHLRGCLREDDTVARLGGDDFAVIAENLGNDQASAVAQAERIAEHIHRAVSRSYPLDVPGGEYTCSASIGITLFKGRRIEADELLKQAEMALYKAKDDGRNLLRFFNPDMQAVVESRAAIERGLREAIANGGFELLYQPQVDRNGRVLGAEALIRWRPADGRHVSPDQFIPLAEETGLIVPIGLWVLDTACAQLAEWQQRPHTRHLTLAINVSAKQFHQPDFTAQVQQRLEGSGVDPSGLKLELTESVILGDIDDTAATMQRIRALGVRFALDDFGTGYSSLSYLKRLPFDQLKIDQSFIHDLMVDNSSGTLVRAMLAMSESLGMEVVAEGVETPAQRDYLKSNGCQVFQGYLYGKPVPIDAWHRQWVVPTDGLN